MFFKRLGEAGIVLLLFVFMFLLASIGLDLVNRYLGYYNEGIMESTEVMN